LKADDLKIISGSVITVNCMEMGFCPKKHDVCHIFNHEQHEKTA
jgi:hypothetical protein